MKLIKVAAGVLNQTPMDWDNNKNNIIGAIRQAKADNVSILCLPEMCICGYGCEDAFYSAGLRRMARTVLYEILPETKGIAVSLGLPVLHRNNLFNAACMVVDGEIIGFTAKQFLARDGLHYEPRWFNAWPQAISDTICYDNKEYPIGDISYDIGGVRVGFEICQDAWAANRPGSKLNSKAVDIIMNPSASHFAFGKYEIRKRFVLEGSRAFGVTYIYSNLLGNEAGRAIYDGGALIAAAGNLAAAGPRLSFKDYIVTSAIIDIDATRMLQTRSGNAEIELAPIENCFNCKFDYPDQTPQSHPTNLPSWQNSQYLKEEEFARAIALALFDYLRKSHSQGFVVSLSGGADSSAVSCLCAILAKLGCNELGLANFLAKAHLAEDITEADLVARILTCTYQGTRNSSETTSNAAKTLAKALSATFMNFDVDDLVQGYISMVETGIGRKLTWATDDLTLQNIQARVRAPGIWMIANINNALLLATSNRSEAAVGYATMDGDTAGGLSPIAGIDKAFLRRWLVWLQTKGMADFGTIEALELVNDQQPTAELRPAENKQTDEADLMPYDLLDAIERLAILEKMTPLEVYQNVQTEFSQYSSEDLKVWVKRFFTLWCRNQWKRERYAPSFHVDDKNLDPKTWCRFPILSGGFGRELLSIELDR
ncbi:MAG: NAD(+) synthase [Phycisphaerae bacterium]|nr:NAD(+) synthase [Phycisphaerae bacterium]